MNLRDLIHSLPKVTASGPADVEVERLTVSSREAAPVLRAAGAWGTGTEARTLAGGTLPAPSAAFAQTDTPPKGSPVRAAILDALRGMVEGEVGKPVELVVSDMRVLGEWAFVITIPQRPGGGVLPFVRVCRVPHRAVVAAEDDERLLAQPGDHPGRHMPDGVLDAGFVPFIPSSG